MFKHSSINRSFKLVWSEARGAYIVAPESAGGRAKSCTSSSGRRAARLARQLAVVAGLAWSGGGAFNAAAQVIPQGNTTTYNNPNGVPVVNISAPNSAGLSHNTFTNYNVDPQGLVLNNINAIAGQRSQLAGHVAGNVNLIGNAAANVILNQVVAPNRSMLRGFTEVVGAKADVVVANQYGITCTGCGFINTDRVTLTTGQPTFNPGGGLVGFAVTGGDVLVNGAGLTADAYNAKVLDIVTRSFKTEGPIAGADDLQIVVGNNTWSYGTRLVTGRTVASGAAPVYAIDSTVLGGIYANTIRLISTEAGVGVRMLGEVGATTSSTLAGEERWGVVDIESAGKIDLNNKISAAKELLVASTATGADAITLDQADLSSSGDMRFTASSGGMAITGGKLVASNALNITAQSLSDTAVSSSDADANKRYAKTALKLNVSGDTALAGGVSWTSGGNVTANLGSLAVTGTGAVVASEEGTLSIATTGDMALNAALVSASNNLSLTAQGRISTTAGVGQGVQSANGDLNITAGNGLDNQGMIAAHLGSLTARVDGTLTNGGELYSKGNMTLADGPGSGAMNLHNSGAKLLTDGRLNIAAGNVTNTGSMQGTLGTTLQANSLDNSGVFIASSDAAADAVTWNLGSLTNSGTLQTRNDLTLKLTSPALNNSGDILSTSGNLTIDAQGAALQINNNHGGTLQANKQLNIKGNQVSLNNAAGAKIIADDLEITATTLSNAGELQGGTGDSNLNVSGDVSNSGTLILATTGAGSGTITANKLNNQGTMQSAGTATLTVTQDLHNFGTGQIMADRLAVRANNLTNDAGGLIQGGTGASTLNVTNTVSNAGTLILATTSAGGGTINAQRMNNSGILQSAGAATLTLAQDLNNLGTGKIMADRLALTVNSLTNNAGGLIQGGTGASTLNVTNTLTNDGTLTLATTASGSGTINANRVTNSGTLQSLGSAALHVATGVSNTAAGKIMAATGLTVRGTDAAYAVDNQGLMQAGGALDVMGGGGGNGLTINIGGSGKMLGQTVALNTQNLAISNGGSLGSTGDMTVTANTLTLGGSNAKIVGATAGGNTTITTTSAFSNPGAIHSGGNLDFRARSVNNTETGGMSALGNLTITASNGDIINAGALYAGRTLTASAAGHTIGNVGALDGAVGTMDSGGDMNLTARTFLNNSVVRAGGAITIDATNFYNEVLGGDTRTWTDGARSGGDTAYESINNGWEGRGDLYTNYFRETWRNTQEYSGGVPEFTPQIVGGTSVTVRNFSGTRSGNRGAIISAPTVNISGTGLFTNDSLALGFEDYQRTWATETLCVGTVCDNNRNYYTNRLIEGSDSGDQKVREGALSTRNAGMYAAIFNAEGFNLTNLGPRVGEAPVASSATASSGAALSATTTLAGTTTAVINVVPVGGKNSILFGGVVIKLPATPNGFFVIAPNAGSRYLVETNPLFTTSNNAYGSSYLAQQLGLNHDSIAKRLGDANYEAYLIRQQLIAQTGRNLLAGYQSEARLLQDMMTDGASEAQALGFVWGEPPSNDKLAQLTKDIVWMVTIEVAGQKVLTPVVYLAKTTIANIQTGSVIAADNINTQNMTSVTNNGGSIIAKDNLNITASGNITNTSGTIQGGNVALTSTEGSIVNQTSAQTDCSDAATFCNSVIGRTAGISATGSLSLDAKQDIQVIGANVSAGGNASLSAGNDIVFDTITSTTRTTDRGQIAEGLASVQWEKVETETKNTGSNLTVGGNLNLNSGRDTELYNATVGVTGNLDATSGGQLVIGTREDTKESKSTVTTTSVFGATLSPEAQAQAGMAADPAAGVGPTTREYSQGSYANAQSYSTGGTAVGYTDNRDISRASGELFSTTTTSRNELATTSKATSITAGGNLGLTAKEGAITIQGSELQAKGNVTLDAKNVEVLAGKDSRTVTTETKRVGFGVFADGKSVSSVEGGASSVNLNEKVDGQVKTENDGAVTFGLRTESKQTTELTVKNVGSKISGGGNVAIQAAESAKFVGAQVAAGNDLSITGKDITSEAAVDEKSTTTQWAQQTIGIGIDARSDTQASGRGRVTVVGTAGAGAKVSADNRNEAGFGIRIDTRSGTSDTGSTNSLGNEFSAGGNITRTATNTITDQATQMTAGRDLKQTAKVIEDVAVADTAWKKTSENIQDLRIGVYSGIANEAKAGGAAGTGGVAVEVPKVESQLTRGVRVTASDIRKSKESKVSNAVVSKYTAGGKIDSTSTEKTTLVGAQLTAGGDVQIAAGEFEFKAAENKTATSATYQETKAEFRAGQTIQASGDSEKGKIEVKTGASAELVGGFESLKIDQTKSTGVAGQVIAGSGAVSIVTTGSTPASSGLRLEGTNISAAQDVTVRSNNGAVVLDAAQNKETREASYLGVQGKAKLTSLAGASAGGDGVKPAAELTAKAEVTTATTDLAYEKVTGSGVTITSKTGNVALEAGASLTTRGAAVKAEVGDVTLAGTRGIEILEATNTTKLTTVGHTTSTAAEIKFGTSTSVAGATAGTVLTTNQETQTGTASSFQSGAGKSINLVSGGPITSQAATFNDTAAPTSANQAIINIALSNVNISEAISVDVNANYGGKKTTEAPRIADIGLLEVKTRSDVAELATSAIERIQDRPRLVPIVRSVNPPPVNPPPVNPPPVNPPPVNPPPVNPPPVNPPPVNPPPVNPPPVNPPPVNPPPVNPPPVNPPPVNPPPVNPPLVNPQLPGTSTEVSPGITTTAAEKAVRSTNIQDPNCAAIDKKLPAFKRLVAANERCRILKEASPQLTRNVAKKQSARD